MTHEQKNEGGKMRGLLGHLTGGRPMRRDGSLFVDLVSGKTVHAFTDKFGRPWMATHAWSWFRVPRISQIEGRSHD